MFQYLFHQAPVVDLWQQFQDVAWAVVTSYGIIIGVAGFAAFIALRIWSRSKDLTPYRIGDYFMEMPHLTERWKCTIFGLNPDRNVDELIAAYRSVYSSDRNQMAIVASLLEENRGSLHFYRARYHDTEGSTRKAGEALITTNAPLEHSDFHRELEAKYDWMRGTMNHVRMIKQSGFDGFIKNDADRIEDGKTEVDFVFFSLTPVTSDAKQDGKMVRAIEVQQHAVANMNQTIITLRTSQQNEIVAKAAAERADKAETLARKYATQLNHERRQRLKKNYWAEQMTSTGSPLSLAIIIVVIGGCAVFLPDFFARNFSGYTMQHYIAAAVAIGAIIVWLIGVFTDRRGSGVGGV